MRADSDQVRKLYRDWVITQAIGQVCVLKLYHGNRRITPADLSAEVRTKAEAEALLSNEERIKKAE